MEKDQKNITKTKPEKIKDVLSGINKFESNLDLLESIWSREKGLAQGTFHYFDNGQIHHHKITR